MAVINYVELSSGGGTGRAASFSAEAFGWRFANYGPTYAATGGEPTNLGLQADGESAPLLPVIEVGDLEAALAKVQAAGGVIVQPVFGFPGGRRFEFTGPDGNRLAVMQPEG